MSCFRLSPRPLAYRCPVPFLLLSLVPDSCFIPSSNRLTHKLHALKKLPPHNRPYQYLIPDEILYHNPSTIRHYYLSSLVTSSFWLMFLLSGFLGCGLKWFVFDRDTPGSGPYANYRTIRRTSRSVLWKLISFSALHNVRERVFIMSLDAQQRYSHCFLDGLPHPTFLIVKTHLDLIFLGSNSFFCFLGFAWFSYLFLLPIDIGGSRF